MERVWPLVGRDVPLRTVAAALRPGSRGVVVAGPAGVGKTRLAREAVAARPRAAGDVVWALASAAARPLPLGAFAGLLDVPADGPGDVVGRALARLADRAPCVVAVDDAHLLDEHSAIVLHRVVVRRLAPVVVTLRTGEPAPDAVTALWKDDLLDRLDLAPLDPAGTAALLARVLGGPVDSASAHRLHDLTQGSPLFLRHLLAGEVAAGRMARASGIWTWTREPSIGAELADLLEQQFGVLEPRLRDVVDVVALAEPVTVPDLVALTAADDVEEAEDRGLVRTDGRVARLAHPLYGEVRRAAMGALRARRLRGLVARTLDATDDPIRRAVLTLDSDLPPDPELFLRAARAATAVFDLPLAERLARAAAATGAPPARLVHAAALSWLSRGAEADAILADVVAQAAAAGDPATGAFAQLHRTGNLLWTMARPDDAAAALADAASTGALRLHVTAMGACLAAAAGDVGTVLATAVPLLDEDLPDDLVRLLVASPVTAAAAVTGRRGLLERAAVVGGLTADGVPGGVPGFGLADLQVLGHRLAGDPARAAEQAGRMRRASADLPGPARLMGLVVDGHATLAAGRVGDALVPLREAWAGLVGSGHEFAHRCRTLLATALGQAGRAPEAHAVLAALPGEHPAYRVLAADDLLARAWACAAEGATTQALAAARTAVALAHDAGAPAYEVLALQTLVQLGDADGALPGLDRLAALSPRAGAAHAHARAAAADDGDALLAAADGWEALGDLLAAGDAAGHAAAAHRRHDRPGAALGAVTRASALAGRSGASTPALAAAVRPLPLTAREREVVELAARGLSNRDIAGRLTVSVRTVEGHLYRAGAKLGVSQRSALAAVVGVE